MATMYIKPSEDKPQFGCYSERGLMSYFMFVELPKRMGDFLILSDLITKSPITAILPPSLFNYPGLISTKDFYVRLDLIPNENLKSENCELFLAKFSTKEIWRLKLAE